MNVCEYTHTHTCTLAHAHASMYASTEAQTQSRAGNMCIPMGFYDHVAHHKNSKQNGAYARTDTYIHTHSLVRSLAAN
jgi:hypothetical protein